MYGKILPAAAVAAKAFGLRQRASSVALRNNAVWQLTRAFSTPPPPSNTVEVEINGTPIQVDKGMTVLQACEAAGVSVPRFCYHQRLSVAGNCRMCLVEVEKSPKPVASCAMPLMPGMKVKTETPLVKKAREGVMEFLLLNHPLDCPICDQGGECDLQDQALVYGSDRSRFLETKRSVVDKNLGPLVKTVMTRCIHCTRCVRFASEVAGVPELGTTGRGRDTEITTYVEKLFDSEVSGNVIDLCPVGALTSKPFAFTARPWELKSTESIDVMDGMGCNIIVNSRGVEVMRVLPRVNEEVNEEWISDKSRFAYDGLKRQRLAKPMIKAPATGLLEEARWPDALSAVAEAAKGVPGDRMLAVAGKMADAESIIALKDLMSRLGCSNLRAEEDGLDAEADVRSAYVCNTGLARMEEADVLLLVGTDPRTEAPVLNIRLRRAAVNAGLRVASVGAPLKLNYPHTQLGEDTDTLLRIAEGRHPFCATLAQAKRPMVVVGSGVLKRKDKDSLLHALNTIVHQAGLVKPGWNGYNVLHASASRVAALDLGFVPGPRAAHAPPPKFVYLLGADNEEVIAGIPDDAFVVYQGHHGDVGARRANVVLPGAAYTEKAATFVNTEGRVQHTRAAVSTVGESRDDWKIVRALSEIMGKTLPYDDLEAVRARLAEVAPHMAKVDAVEPVTWRNGDLFAHRAVSSVDKSPLEKLFPDFYMTDVISRSSKTMARCSLAKKMPPSVSTEAPAGHIPMTH
eukprot:jgi/Mesvir1/22683/Mv14106-RA.1